MSEELLPCPKCNGIAELDGQRGYIPFGEPRGIVNSMAVIYCLICGCELSHECENTANLLDAEYDAVIAELIAAWNTRQTPKVKALEWVTDVSAGARGKFGNGLFNYQVAWNHTSPDKCYWKWRRANSSTWYTGFDSPDAAKAAAQADYERRILSALEE